MGQDRASQPATLICADMAEFVREAARRSEEFSQDRPDAPPTYRLVLGREPIPLGILEFRVLLFLASKPYYAFSRRQIIEGVATATHPLTEETLDECIASLREQLGFFRDYVQTVPYIGYRFKP